jgi:hypothetical protein
VILLSEQHVILTFGGNVACFEVVIMGNHFIRLLPQAPGEAEAQCAALCENHMV